MTSLFSPFTLGSMTARNSMIRAAVAESLCSLDGEPSRPLIEAYTALAEGGVGTIITGFAYFSAEGKPAERALNLGDLRFSPAIAAMVKEVQSHGAKMILQLVYGGSKSVLSPNDPRWLPAAADEALDGVPNAEVLGPSAVINANTGIVPKEATTQELSRLVEGFARAAQYGKTCGFDGVEIHSAHGYMLSQFLSPNYNHRSDGYGGPIENRARLTAEIIAATRKAVGPDYPILVKLNSSDSFFDPQGLEGGLSESDSAQAAKFFQDAGASALEVSGDWHNASKEITDGQPYFGAYGSRLAKALAIPVIVTGGWRQLPVVETFLATSGIAAVGLARPLIREPHLANRWEFASKDPSLCIGCGICTKHGGTPCPNRL